MIRLLKPIFNTEECLSEIRECLDSGWTGAGFKTTKFEHEFSKYTGLENCLFLNSATSGLHLALELAKHRKPHAEFVITTPLTFIATNHAIMHASLSPWFLDIDEHLTLDSEEVFRKLNKRDGSIVAVIFVGLGGNIGQLLKVTDICFNYNIPLILDAAHCMGTYVGDYHIGSGVDYAVFSFQSVKNLPTADSGMLVCKSELDDKLARKLSWLGIDRNTEERAGSWEYNIEHLGWKYHGNSIMASIALVQLKYLKTHNNIRRLQAKLYDDGLDSITYKRIPIPKNCLSSRHLYQLRMPAQLRDELIVYAKNNGIQLGVHYRPSTEYIYYRHQRNLVPKASEVWKELVSLPIGPHLTEKDCKHIVEVLNEFASSKV